MKNIVFTYPTPIENEIDQVIGLFESGIDVLHIRKQDISFGELVDYIIKIPSEYHNQIMVHSHYPIIGEFDLAGINLNRKSLGQVVLKEEIDKCFIQPLVLTEEGIEVNRCLAKNVSYSAHSFKEIENLSIDADYIFLSPIFDSISKVDYNSNFTNIDFLKSELARVDKNVVALGGVTIEKIDECKELGFTGFARLGDAWKRSNE